MLGLSHPVHRGSMAEDRSPCREITASPYVAVAREVIVLAAFHGDRLGYVISPDRSEPIS